MGLSLSGGTPEAGGVSLVSLQNIPRRGILKQKYIWVVLV